MFLHVAVSLPASRTVLEKVASGRVGFSVYASAHVHASTILVYTKSIRVPRIEAVRYKQDMRLDT